MLVCSASVLVNFRRKYIHKLPCKLKATTNAADAGTKVNCSIRLNRENSQLIQKLRKRSIPVLFVFHAPKIAEQSNLVPVVVPLPQYLSAYCVRILGIQKSRLLFISFCACSQLYPCQKSPSQNIAIFRARNAISGFPKIVLLFLVNVVSPWRTSSSHRSFSSAVSLLRTRLIVFMYLLFTHFCEPLCISPTFKI